MRTVSGTTVWSDNSKVSLRMTEGSDEVEIRVIGGWQFLTIDEFLEMAKGLKHAARTRS